MSKKMDELKPKHKLFNDRLILSLALCLLVFVSA